MNIGLEVYEINWTNIIRRKRFAFFMSWKEIGVATSILSACVAGIAFPPFAIGTAAMGVWAFGTAVVGGASMSRAMIGVIEKLPSPTQQPQQPQQTVVALAQTPIAVTLAPNVSLSTIPASSEKTSCFICESNEGNLIYVDCGHAGICRACACKQQLPNCAICRAPVKFVMQIFKVKNE